MDCIRKRDFGVKIVTRDKKSHFFFLYLLEFLCFLDFELIFA